MGRIAFTVGFVCAAVSMVGTALAQDELAFLPQGGQGGVAGDPGDAEFTRKTHILTPGQTGEWTFEAKQNDCVWATASSQAFDPAIEVLDPDGKVVASNDDVAPGAQEARVLLRFAKEGKHKLIVKGFKGVAGGQYEITFRQFSAPVVAVGGDMSGRKGRDDSPNAWVAVELKQGQAVSVTLQGAFVRGLEVLAPDGSAPGGVLDRVQEGPNARQVFRAGEAGLYFFRFGIRREEDYKVAPRQVLEFSGNVPSPLQLDGYTLAFVSIPVQPTTMYEASLETLSGEGRLDFPPYANPVVRNLPRFYGVESRAKRPNQGRFVARTEQPCVAVVSTPIGRAGSFGLPVRSPAQGLSVQASANLQVGDMDFFRVDCRAGQVMRFNATSEAFDAMLVVKNMWGQQIGSSGDKDGLNPGVTLAISENGPVYVGVASEGNGGGGAYVVTSSEAEAIRLVPGTTTAGKGRGAGDPEIWKVDGKKGETILVNVRAGGSQVHAVVYGPDGRALLELANSAGRAEGGRILSLPADGSYTVWAWCDSGAPYSIQWLDTGSG